MNKTINENQPVNHDIHKDDGNMARLTIKARSNGIAIIEINNNQGACGVGVIDEDENLVIVTNDDTPLEIPANLPFKNVSIKTKGKVRIIGDGQFDDLKIQASTVQLDSKLKIQSSLNILSKSVEQKGILDLRTAQTIIKSQSINSYGNISVGESFKVDATSLTLRKKAHFSALSHGQSSKVINLSKALIIGADTTFECESINLNTQQARINGKGVLSHSTLKINVLNVCSNRPEHHPELLFKHSELQTNHCQYNGNITMLNSRLSCQSLNAYQKIDMKQSAIIAEQQLNILDDCQLHLNDHSLVKSTHINCLGELKINDQSHLECEQIRLAQTLCADNSSVCVNKNVVMLNKDKAQLVLKNKSILQAERGLMDGVVQLDESSLEGSQITTFADLNMKSGRLKIDTAVSFENSALNAEQSIIKFDAGYLNGSVDIDQSNLNSKRLGLNHVSTIKKSKIDSDVIDAQGKIAMEESQIKSELFFVENTAKIQRTKIKTKTAHFCQEAQALFKESLLDSDLSLFEGTAELDQSAIKAKKSHITKQLDAKESKIQSDRVFIDKQGSSSITDTAVDAKRSFINCGKVSADTTKDTAQVGIKAGNYINAGEDQRDKISVVTSKKYASTVDSKTTVINAMISSKGDADFGGNNHLTNTAVQSMCSITMLSGSNTYADNVSFDAKENIDISTNANIEGSSIQLKCNGFSNLGSISMKKQFHAEVDTFFNTGSLDGGEHVNIKADLFFINMLGALSGNDVHIKSALFNANILADLSGSESLSLHALANCNLYGVQRSWNLHSSSFLNLNSGLQGAFVLPKKWETVFKMNSLISLSKSILTSVFPESSNVINTIFSVSSPAFSGGMQIKRQYDEFKDSKKDLYTFILDKLNQKTTAADKVSMLLKVKDYAQSAYEFSQTDFSSATESWIPDFSGFMNPNTNLWDIGAKVAQTSLGIVSPTQSKHSIFDINLGTEFSGNLNAESIFSYNHGISFSIQHNNVSSHWQHNDGICYSLFGMTNLHGHHFENNGVIGSGIQTNFKFHHMDFNDRGRVIGTSANYQSNTANLNGEMDVDSASFNIQEFNDTVDLICAQNQYANYRVRKNLSVIANDYVKMDRDIKRNCGISVKAKGVKLDVDYDTNHNVDFETTEDDVIISSKVRAKSIRCKSAKDTITTGDIEAEDDSYYQSEGSHINQGGRIKSGKHTSIFAKKDILNECVETNIQGAYDTLKEYKKGAIIGGTGENHENLGLQMAAEGKVINDASTIESDSDGSIYARRGFEGKARSHRYTSNVREKQSGTGIFKKKKIRKTTSEQIEGNEVISRNGKMKISIPEGGADTTSTNFITEDGTKIYARDNVNFNALIGKNSTYKKTSSVGGLLHDTEKSTTEFLKKTIMADNGVSVVYSTEADINAKGADFIGSGDTHLKAKNIIIEDVLLSTDYSRRTSSITASSNVTDFAQKISSGNQSIAALHPLSDSVNNASESNNPIEIANEAKKSAQMVEDMLNNGVSPGDIAGDVLKQTGLGDKNGVNPSLTATLSKTETSAHSERAGGSKIDRNNLVIEADQEAKLKGIKAIIRENATVKAKIFNQESLTCHSNSQTKTKGVSISTSLRNPTSPTVGVNQSSSSSTSTQHINQELMVGRNLHVDVQDWNMNGANVDTHTLSGHANNLKVTSQQSVKESQSSSSALSTAGSASFSQSNSSSRAVDQRSSITIRSKETPPQGQGFHADKTELTSADIKTGGTGQFSTGELNNHTLVDELKNSQYGFSAAIDGSGSNLGFKGNQFQSHTITEQKCFVAEGDGLAPKIGKVSGDFVTEESKKTQQIAHSETPGIMQSFDSSMAMPKTEPSDSRVTLPYYDEQSDEFEENYSISDDISSMNNQGMDQASSPLQDQDYALLENQIDFWSDLDSIAPANQSPMPIDEENQKPLAVAPINDQQPEKQPATNVDENHQNPHPALSTDSAASADYRPMQMITDSFNLATQSISEMTKTQEFAKHYAPLGTGFTFFANVDQACAKGSETPFVDAAVDTAIDTALDRATDLIPGAQALKTLAVVGKFQQEFDLYAVKNKDLDTQREALDQALKEGNTSQVIAHSQALDRLAQAHAIERLPTFISQGVDKTMQAGKTAIKDGAKKLGTAMAYSQCVQANALAPAKFQMDCEATYLGKEPELNQTNSSKP